MKVPRRPGVYPKWSRSWKATRSNLVKWRDIHGPDTTKELDHYARHGRRATPGHVMRGNPPYRSWENNQLDMDLHLLGLLRVFELEQRGMAGEAFDSTLAMHAFAAVYTSQVIALEFHNQAPARFGGTQSSGLETDAIPFTALGLVAGCRAEALKLGRAQTAAYRKGWYQNDTADFPIFIFILRMLAAYLEEPAIRLNRAAAHPILTALFDLRRAPGTEELQQVCLAACDLHTHQYKPGGEFEHIAIWARTPIEILLLFKLRQLAGLPNPQLDHPLMNTPLGQLPQEVTFAPDELVTRVRARMTKSGYDEAAILAKAIKPLKR